MNAGEMVLCCGNEGNADEVGDRAPGYVYEETHSVSTIFKWTMYCRTFSILVVYFYLVCTSRNGVGGPTTACRTGIRDTVASL